MTSLTRYQLHGPRGAVVLTRLWLFPATPETRAGWADQYGVRTHVFLQRLMQLFNLHIISSDSYIHAHGVKNLALNAKEFE